MILAILTGAALLALLWVGWNLREISRKITEQDEWDRRSEQREPHS